MHRKRLIGLLLGACLWISSADAQERQQPIIEMTYERARFHTGERTLVWFVGAEQWIELGGQRGRRVQQAARATAEPQEPKT